MMQSGETAALGERVAQAGREANVRGRGAVNSGEGAHLLLGSGEQRGGVAGAVNADVNIFNAMEGVKGR
jgi:hypothetical protein